MLLLLRGHWKFLDRVGLGHLSSRMVWDLAAAGSLHGIPHGDIRVHLLAASISSRTYAGRDATSMTSTSNIYRLGVSAQY